MHFTGGKEFYKRSPNCLFKSIGAIPYIKDAWLTIVASVQPMADLYLSVWAPSHQPIQQYVVRAH